MLNVQARRAATVSAFVLALVGGCASRSAGHSAPEHASAAAPLQLSFATASGESIKADAQLQPTEKGVHIRITVADAKPGSHGVHVHQKADCSDIPGKSMGDHFSPDEQPHGFPSSSAHHLGDLGNIEVAEDGTGQLEITLAVASLENGERASLLGRALVIHEKADVGPAEQPAGDSGAPIACAAIRR